VTAAPELSVVTVTYECRRHALALLDDLAAAREALALEVLVVDNASTDGTVAAIRALHPWVDVDAGAANVGFGAANNRAIARVRAPVVALLNPDTRVGPGALAACAAELARDPSVGILTPRVVDGDGRFDRRCMRGFPTLWGVACHVSGADRLLRDRRSRRYTQGWLPDDRPADVEAVSGAVMFARAVALRAVGGFDERFFMYGEDIDLCLRVARAGWRVRYWPGATVTHTGGGSGWTPASRAAWARAIGDLHRVHRPGVMGRIAGGACDLGGRLLDATRALGDRRRGRRETPPLHSRP
jgi:hypothetical protein